jgi:hypothetical protein
VVEGDASGGLEQVVVPLVLSATTEAEPLTFLVPLLVVEYDILTVGETPFSHDPKVLIPCVFSSSCLPDSTSSPLLFQTIFLLLS